MKPVADELRLFWGKAGKDSEKKEPAYHSALCHMLDVALVAYALLNYLPDSFRDTLFLPMTGTDDEKRRWIAFFIAGHDTGKISPGFQNKRPDLIKMLSKLDFPFSESDVTDHGKVTHSTFGKILTEKAKCPKLLAMTLSNAVGAHHGRFSEPLRSGFGGGKWEDARVTLVETLLEVFDLSWERFPFDKTTRLRSEFVMVLAGLTSVADWIGSDESQFTYTGNSTTDVKAYFEERLVIAHQAIKRLHLDEQPLSGGISDLREIFHYLAKDSEFIPNACQTVTLELFRRLTGPLLILVETPMGSGKTEAALGITDICIRERNAAGLYYALPTKATGNQMFGRIRDFLKHHPACKNPVELHLLHGNADLVGEYQQMQIASICDGDPERASVIASTWFTAKKRGLIAPFSVGTVDQALLAAMQSRHMFVRLFGLAGKVVVIDEVHAYDTYTSTILDRLLNWLSALGCTVILLSATLPVKRRRELVRAFSRQCNEIPESPYPCILGVTRDGHAQSQPVTGLEPKSFQIQLLQLRKAERWSAIARILRMELENGGCGVCLMNTVGEAQDLFAYLQNNLKFDNSLPTVWQLFHARFPSGQRQQIEEAVEKNFGKDDKENPNIHRPKRAVVVATQVLEQSLDVDFDVMLSDLAPIDLLLQRAGRLQRHKRQRPNHFQNQARFYCLMPDLESEEADFGPSGKVYWNSILLRTALVLKDKDKTQIQLPEHVETLIGSVYGPNEIECPEHLTGFLDLCNIEKKELDRQATSFAKERLLAEPNVGEPTAITEQNYTLDEDDQVPMLTRLARQSITIIVLHGQGDQVFLDSEYTTPINFNQPPNKEATRELLKCAVNISKAEWVNYFKGNGEHPAWEKSAHLKYCRPAVFRDGVITHNQSVLRYDINLGIVT